VRFVLYADCQGVDLFALQQPVVDALVATGGAVLVFWQNLGAQG
jgi:hypothetical protein